MELINKLAALRAEVERTDAEFMAAVEANNAANAALQAFAKDNEAALAHFWRGLPGGEARQPRKRRSDAGTTGQRRKRKGEEPTPTPPAEAA